eukprot:1281684-Amphidinium_carterae.1
MANESQGCRYADYHHSPASSTANPVRPPQLTCEHQTYGRACRRLLPLSSSFRPGYHSQCVYH